MNDSEIGLGDKTTDFLNGNNLEITYTAELDKTELNEILDVPRIITGEKKPDQSSSSSNDGYETGDEDEKEETVSETVEILKEMADIFNTKLSLESTKLCLSLIDAGADPNALADLLKNWRKNKAPKAQRPLAHRFRKFESKQEWIP